MNSDGGPPGREPAAVGDTRVRVGRQAGRHAAQGTVTAGAAAVVAVVLVVALVVVLLLLLGSGESSRQAGTGGPETSVAAPPTTMPPMARETVGLSVQGRPIDKYSLGSGAVRVLVIGGIHGDETGDDVAEQLVDYLQDDPGAVPEGVRFEVIPNANPDGEVLDTRANANGVDLNRNFPSSNWSAVLGAGDRPTAGLSGGGGPGSEPETQALLAVLAGGCDLVISLHSSGGIIDYDGPDAATIAERMSALSGLPVGHLEYQAHVTGSLGTYGPEAWGTPVITVELDGAVLTDGLSAALLTALVPGR